ncbi:MAG: hypothetical protein ACP5OG_01925 [Candidatus Nanoarchaeia archaeon]
MDNYRYLLIKQENKLDIVPKHPSFPIVHYSWRELKKDPKKTGL